MAAIIACKLAISGLSATGGGGGGDAWSAVEEEDVARLLPLVLVGRGRSVSSSLDDHGGRRTTCQLVPSWTGTGSYGVQGLII